MKKKFMLVFIIFAMVAFVSACSDDEASTTKDEDSSDVTNIVVSGDTVSEQGGCVLASRFTVGDKIVFRMNAVDPETNEQITDAKLQVHLSTGDVLDMTYGEHPPGVENPAKFWVVAYPVTEDTPTGQLDYYITADAGDSHGEYRPFNVAPSLLTIVGPETTNGEAAATEETEEASAEPTGDVETNQTVDIVAKNFEFNKDAWYVKAGEEVTLNLTSEEGAHGVFINGLDVGLDKDGTVTFTPTEAGEYDILCSVFCGTGHADMKSKLVVVE